MYNSGADVWIWLRMMIDCLHLIALHSLHFSLITFSLIMLNRYHGQPSCFSGCGLRDSKGGKSVKAAT